MIKQLETMNFSVSALAEGVSGYLHVIGRCGDVAIKIGDRFESIYHYDNATLPDGREIATPVIDHLVHSEVKVISAYSRESSELGNGMTGRLSPMGRGTDLVRPGCVLGVMNPTTMAVEPDCSGPSNVQAIN